MEDKDYPSLYRAADIASKKAQRIYLFLMGLDLSFMIFGASLSVYNFQNESPRVWLYITGSLLLVLGLFLTLILKIIKYEDIWYQGRALAESVKTLTWKFITGSEGFEITLSKKVVDDLFVDRIKELATKFRDYTKHFDSKILLLPTITDKISEQRSKTFNERKDFYNKCRIKEQKEWYATKANQNNKRHTLWFIVILISQILAICSSYYLIRFPDSNWNTVGLFTTIASVGIAWLQLKHHQELKQAYTTATIELKYIEDKSNTIQFENELAKYVFDSENAISREHTLWLAQKRK